MPDTGKIIEMVGFLGNLCSIAAVLLMIGVFSKLRRISRNFLFQARFPSLKKKIASHRSKLSSLLNTFQDSCPEIAVELKKCHANLKSLRPKLDRARRSNVKTLLKCIKLLSPSSSPQYKDQVYAIYLDLVLLEEELANLSEDIKWRPRE